MQQFPSFLGVPGSMFSIPASEATAVAEDHHAAGEESRPGMEVAGEINSPGVDPSLRQASGGTDKDGGH